MKSVWLMAALTAMACSSAGAGTPHWTFEADAGTCTLRQKIEGNSRKPQIDIALTWHGVTGHGVHVDVPAVFARDAVVRVQSKNGAQSWSRPANGSGPVARAAAADVLRKNLLRGLPILVTFEGGGIRRLTYSTSVEGISEASAAFEACIRDEIQRVAKEDREPRWISSVDLRGGCSMGQHFPDATGLFIGFNDARSGGVSFEVRAVERYFPDGGVMSVHLPGQAPPWQVQARGSHEPSANAAMLLDELRQGRRPRLVFEPRGVAPVELSVLDAGLAESVAMFDACRSMRAKPRPALAPLSVLDYTIESSASQCQFSASYQIEAAVIWLVAVADAQGRHINVTRRHGPTGARIRYLDLRSLGKPSLIDADDAVISLDARGFDALMRGLTGEGLEIAFLETPSRAYRTRYGGPHAMSEAAMFDACVRAKYPSRP